MCTRSKTMMVLNVLVLALAGATTTASADDTSHQSAAQDAGIATLRNFDIAAQPAATALNEFARQADITLVFSYELVAGYNTKMLKGSYSIAEALKHMLQGTQLSYQQLSERTVAINDGAAGKASGNLHGQSSLRLSQAGAGTSAASAPARQDSESRSGENASSATDSISEIVVTAQKREERLQDVPIPVTVLSAERLAADNQLLLRDYFSSVPGLNVAPGLYEQLGLSIRGITTGSGNPTVGIMVDDATFGGSTQGTQGNLVPNIDPGDLARIEVLRGPQGTLYGANSLGGLLKFVTKDPSTDGFSGRVEAGTSSVSHGDDPGFNIRGSVNIPINDAVAIRASAFRRQDPGYIDNPLLTQKDLNEGQAEGARLTALLKLPADFSLKLSALYQKTTVNDTSEVYGLPGGELQHDSVPGVGGDTREVQAYSAIVKGKLGNIDLISVTAYSENKDTNSLDYSHALGGLVQLVYGVSGTAFFNWLNTKKFSEEVRLTIPLGEKFEWLVGGYYTDEDTPGYETQPALDRETGRYVAEAIAFTFPRAYKEYAAFTDLTYRFSDRFDVQIGARQSRLKESDLLGTASGPFTAFYYPGQPDPVITPGVHSENDAFTYLLTPRLKLGSDWMAYARIASGYRPGGPNIGSINVPTHFEPDKTRNYEVGLKGDFLDRKVSVDASLYYIDWTNLQIQLINPQGFGYTANASEAKSQGAEVAVQVRPLTGLAIDAWVAFTDAVLTERFPVVSQAHGEAGDRLPFSSRVSGNIAVHQSFPLGNNLTGFVGASASFVGDRIGSFTGTAAAAAPRQKYPSYTKTDLRAGVSYEAWTANVFVNNVADVRGQLNGGLGYFYPFAYQYITPRTVGLTISKSF